MLVDVWDEKKFQFTHPGGVRHTFRDQSLLHSSFNSRTREGCDFREEGITT